MSYFQLNLAYTSSAISVGGINVVIPAKSLFLIGQYDANETGSHPIYASVVSFVDSSFEDSFNHDDFTFNITIDDSFAVDFSFVPAKSDILSRFTISTDGFYSLNSTPIGSSNDSLLSLNGDCGSFVDGASVNVLGKIGSFNVVSSHFCWDDVVKKTSMIVYKLEKGSKYMYAPDVLVSLNLDA